MPHFTHSQELVDQQLFLLWNQDTLPAPLSRCSLAIAPLSQSKISYVGLICSVNVHTIVYSSQCSLQIIVYPQAVFPRPFSAATPWAWNPCRHVWAMLDYNVLLRHVMMVKNNVFKILIHGRDIFHRKVDRRGWWI